MFQQSTEYKLTGHMLYTCSQFQLSLIIHRFVQTTQTLLQCH